MPLTSFKERTYKALLISLCIHLTFFILLTILPRKKVIYENESAINVDIMLVTKPRVILPRLKPSVAKERRQIDKSIKPFSLSRTPTDINFDQPSFNETATIPLTKDNFVQTSPPIETEKAPISTAVKGVREKNTTIPSSSVTRGTGWRGRGSNGFGMQEVSQGRSSAEISAEILEYIDSTKTDDGIVPRPEPLSILARKIVVDSGGSPIDVVFVVDTSVSMHNNIPQVAARLEKMIDVYEASGINYALGLVQFRAYTQKENSIEIWQLERDFKKLQSRLRRLSVRGDENAYDAIYDAIFKIRFRPTSQKHFILVTDEPFHSLRKLSFEEVVQACNEFLIKVNVLGIDDKLHKQLAKQTGGHWHRIP